MTNSMDPRMDLVTDPTALIVDDASENERTPLCHKIAGSSSMYSWRDTPIEIPFVEPLAEQLLDTFKNAMGGQEDLHWERVAPHFKKAWSRVALCAIQQLLHVGFLQNLPFSAALPACKLGAEIRCAEWPEGIVLVYGKDAVSTEDELLFKVDPIAQNEMERRAPGPDQRGILLFEMFRKAIPENNWEISGKWELPKEIHSFVDMGVPHNMMTSVAAPMCL